jgi:hypothetical protein
VSDQISPTSELCATKVDGKWECGHSPASHFEEAIPADFQVPGGPSKIRGGCLCRGCDCTGYTRPKK